MFQILVFSKGFFVIGTTLPRCRLVVDLKGSIFTDTVDIICRSKGVFNAKQDVCLLPIFWTKRPWHHLHIFWFAKIYPMTLMFPLTDITISLLAVLLYIYICKRQLLTVHLSMNLLLGFGCVALRCRRLSCHWHDTLLCRLVWH